VTLDRRRFLQASSLAMAAPLAAIGRQAFAAPAEDYRALICVLLAGGADSFNMLVPFDQADYDDYAAIRSDLALPRAELLALSGSTAGRRFAVHPGMSELRDLYDAGDLGFIANVGTLAEPTDRAAIDAGTARLPLGLFSHADQINQWQTSVPDQRIATGVGGRLADALDGGLAGGVLPLGVSLSGANLFQTGIDGTAYDVDPLEGVRQVAGYGAVEDGSELFTSALDALLAADYGDPFRRSYARRLRSAIDTGEAVRGALETAPALATPFDDDRFSQSLRQIVRLISVRDRLGASRQTFFVTFGGWDHHDDVIPQQAEMLPMVSRGLAALQSALDELAVADCVTTFTISDFGRTLTSNGKGSDHGWGGNNLVLGRAVTGGRIYGDYPQLVPDNPLDVGRGIYIPTTASDAYYAELALWFGLPAARLPAVLPNVARFYDPASGVAPLGFMA